MSGYRSYIISALVVIASALFGFGFIDYVTYITILGVLDGAAVATIRAAITNETSHLPQPQSRDAKGQFK